MTAGTIFHRTRTPLSTWFAAIWFVTSQKNGVSARACSRSWGSASYETAWAWLHKLRRAMVRPDRERLSGHRGGRREPWSAAVSPGSGASTDKVPVMIAVERNGVRRLGRVRLERGRAAQAAWSWSTWPPAVIEPGSTIRTDGARMLRRLAELGYTHDTTPPATRGRGPGLGPARRAPGRLTAQTLADRHPAPPGRANSTCPTTSTSSPSGSTGAPPRPAACCSTGSCSRP